MAFAARRSFAWQLRTRTLQLGPRTLLMGILNVTPDSFSDGGKYSEVEHALTRASEMLREGADVLDIGGESTRPGSTPLAPGEELARVMPVLRGVVRTLPAAIISVDTYHAETASAALEAGAEIINDVSGGTWDPDMLPLCAKARCGLVLMHTRGRPAEWQNLPPLLPAEVVPLVTCELCALSDAAVAAGVSRESIVLDPGFGFGKILDENYALLAEFGQIGGLGYPLLAGVSRKGFLRRALEHSEPNGAISPGALRDATTAANVAAVSGGAHILRVHDVRSARRAATVCDHLLEAPSLGFVGVGASDN